MPVTFPYNTFQTAFEQEGAVAIIVQGLLGE